MAQDPLLEEFRRTQRGAAQDPLLAEFRQLTATSAQPDLPDPLSQDIGRRGGALERSAPAQGVIGFGERVLSQAGEAAEEVFGAAKDVFGHLRNPDPLVRRATQEGFGQGVKDFATGLIPQALGGTGETLEALKGTVTGVDPGEEDISVPRRIGRVTGDLLGGVGLLSAAGVGAKAGQIGLRSAKSARAARAAFPTPGHDAFMPGLTRGGRLVTEGLPASLEEGLIGGLREASGPPVARGTTRAQLIDLGRNPGRVRGDEFGDNLVRPPGIEQGLLEGLEEARGAGVPIVRRGANDVTSPEGVKRARHAADAPQDPTLARRAGPGGVAGSRVFRRAEVERMLQNPQEFTKGWGDVIAESRAAGETQEQLVSRMTRMIENDAGFAHNRVMLTLGAGAAGAAGGALASDDPTTAIGLAIAMGLVGAGSVVALNRFVAQSPDIAKTFFDGLATTRAELALTGTAIPKNIANALGAPTIAALERGNIAPLREIARLPTNAKVFMNELRNPSVDIGVTGMRRSPTRFLLAPTRVIGAIDETAIQALRRAGLSSDDVNRLMVRRPLSDFLTKNQMDALNNHIVRQLALFVRTPANVLFGGFDEVGTGLTGRGTAVGKANQGLTPAQLAARKNVTRGVMALGVGAGAATSEQDSYLRLLGLGLAGAFFGVRAIPFAMGAATGSAAAGASSREPLQGLAPFPEFALDPVRAVTGLGRPAIMPLVENLSGASATRGGSTRPTRRDRSPRKPQR